jgi:hypothetical protein
MEVLAGRRQKKLQNQDSMQLEDTGSVGLFFKQFYLYYLQGNIMPIASHLVSKNSIVDFGALTDSTLLSLIIKKHMFKSTFCSVLFSSFGSSERI